MSTTDTGLSPAAIAVTSAALLLAACAEGDGATAWPAHARDLSQATDAPQLLRGRPLARQSDDAQRQPDAQTLFDWAERSYPQFFPSHESNLSSGDITYRWYPATGNYVGVAGTEVYVLGPVSNNAPLRVGSLADFAALVHPRFQPATREQAARFLLQAQVAATDEDIAAVMGQGFEGWLRVQFALPLGERAWDWLEARGYNIIDQHTYYDGGHPFFDHAAFKQVLSAPDGLRKRIQLALTEYFVISLGSTSPPWPHFTYATYWDGLGQHAFGNFRDLLEHVTLSASMGAFLNTAGNQKEDATGRVPDENYAREVMQLFTIGLHELHPDGTLRRNAQGQPVETYGADTVTQLARVFTGYALDETGDRFTTLVGGGTRPAYPYSRRPMRFDANLHSPLQARFLGATVLANTPGPQALKIALDALFNHTNVGPFFGRQLIQRLVTSDPSPAYVGRVAAAFNNNGAGVRGDMQATIAAVLLDEEARGEAGLTSLRHGKLREPALRHLQWARTFRLISKGGYWKFGFSYGNPDFDFGQRLFWAPSVFNFFRPGFVPPGTAMAVTGNPAPEFQIVNESSVAQYINSLEIVVLDGLWVFAPERRDIDQREHSTMSGYGDLVPDYSREMVLAHDAPALVERLNLLLCAGQLSAGTTARLVAALNTVPVSAAASSRDRHVQVARAVLTIMVCPEYLVQK